MMHIIYTFYNMSDILAICDLVKPITLSRWSSFVVSVSSPELYGWGNQHGNNSHLVLQVWGWAVGKLPTNVKRISHCSETHSIRNSTPRGTINRTYPPFGGI